MAVDLGLPTLVLIGFIAMLFAPIFMARNRNRSGFLWFLIGCVGSPILAILLLYALGENKET